MQSLHTRWLHLLGVLVLSVELAACGGRTTQEREVAIRAPSDRPQQEDGANGSETTLHVVATDFTFALDAAQVRAGTITFLTKNEGMIPHDFAIQGNGMDQKTTRVKPGHTVTLTVDLQPGTYTYKCTVPGHALLGMKGTLTVPAVREHAAPQHLRSIRRSSLSRLSR
jgi:plastocyanin